MNHTRPLVVVIALSLLPFAARADDDSLGTQLMHCTFKITNGRTQGTAFVLNDDGEGAESKWILLTAAHAFEQMKEDEATLVLRKQGPNDSYEKLNHKFRIRREGKPLWAQHPSLDAAAIYVSLPTEAVLPRLPVELLATDELLQRHHVQPGDILRCVGFPHAGQFEPNKAGFPVVRMGCLASFPLLPTKQTRTFLFDFNTFEGDSGGPVYLDEPNRMRNGRAEPVRLILGIVHGQHFIEENFKSIYQSGQTRHRLGLSIVTHATAAHETIDLLREMNNEE